MGSFEEDFLTKLSFAVRLRNVAVIHQVVFVHSIFARKKSGLLDKSAVKYKILQQIGHQIAQHLFF